MMKKILSLVLIFAAVPGFAATGALEQLQNGAGGSIPAVRAGLPANAPVAADNTSFGDADPAELYFKSAPLPPLPVKSYETAVKEFQAYRQSKRAIAKNEYNLPFILDHGYRTQGTVLMIHGLTDSPWFMRALGEKLYQQGYNVIGILLPGHGSRPEDLFHVKGSQWQEEVDRGLGMAVGLGERISLAGFSTGGTLSLDALRRHPDLRAEKVFLFSPALAMNEANQPKVTLGCISPWLAAQFMGDYSDAKPETIREDNPYRYNKMPVNGVCQLYYLTKDVQKSRPAILKSLGSGTKVFTVQSGADTTVSPGAVNSFMASLTGSANEFIWYPAEAGIAHAAVTRPETNPRFPELLLKLQDFTGGL